MTECAVTLPDGTHAILLMGGPDFTIAAGGKLFRFEMHPQCGPAVLNAAGHPADNQPGPRSPFWKAVTAWHQQGQRVGADGLCVWEPESDIPPGFVLVHMGGRHYRVAPAPAGMGG